MKTSDMSTDTAGYFHLAKNCFFFFWQQFQDFVDPSSVLPEKEKCFQNFKILSVKLYLKLLSNIDVILVFGRSSNHLLRLCFHHSWF
jgi:hypothetical protein